VTDAGVLDIGELPTSATLLEKIRRSDPEGWKRFVLLYAPLIYRWCRRAGLRDEDAKDVGQDVFAAVARSIGEYQHRSFRGWLRVITDRKILDRLRRAPVGGDGVGGSDAQNAIASVTADWVPRDSDADEADDRLLLLRQATELVLASCQEATRQAFLRIVIGDEDPATVASDLGLTENAVYLAKSRLLKRIRDEFAELVDAASPDDSSV
jgi:RNA polymerase sigma-70 factor (ECF subfamily)